MVNAQTAVFFATPKETHRDGQLQTQHCSASRNAGALSPSAWTVSRVIRNDECIEGKGESQYTSVFALL
jgi:hypothetical protein